jgi:hypothetical protein
MTTPPYLVVGAGPSGLGFATELARQAGVVLIDRLPVTGGAAGWAGADVREFTAEAVRQGVRLRLGESALRWEQGVLLVAGPGRSEKIAGRHLLFCGGLRPATAAGLNLAGDRPAGVLAGIVAEHLLAAGVRLWGTAVVLGDGPWARPVAERARALGTRVTAVTDRGDWGDERFGWPERLTVIGRDRVTHLRLHTSQAVTDVPCDAVVLAADPAPNRNVEGALLEGAPAVTFHQPLRPHAAAQRYELAVRAAQSLINLRGRRSCR